MQETLDPTIGHSEINERKKEIHIMELRLKELQKKKMSAIKVYLLVGNLHSKSLK